MSQSVTGVIEDVATKMINTKYGEKPVYTVTISGQKYGHGFKAVPFGIGTQVTGSVKQNGNFMNIENLMLAGNAEAPVANTAAPTPAPAKPATQPAKTDWDKKDRQIMKQNAVTNANAYFANQIAAGNQAVPTTADVIDVAKAFFEFYTE